MHDHGWYMAAIFFGSSLGGFGRAVVSGYVTRRFGGSFPYGTMTVNVTGAFLAGLIWALATAHPLGAEYAATRDVLLLGVLGGYTTVSAFSLNTFSLLQDRAWLPAAANLLGTWALCLGAVYAGAAAGGGL